VSAIALIVLVIFTGLVATSREARIAEANRQRAEKRFNDVRKLANFLLFEIHDSIRQLPGATSARKLIIARAQEYLDVLARDSKSDPSLLGELGIAYGRLASVQGNSQDANLGQTSQAVQNYRKAADLLFARVSLEPSNPEALRDLAGSYQDLGLALSRSGDKSGSKGFTQKAVRILEPLAAAHVEDEKDQFALGTAYQQTGAFLADENDLSHAGEYYQRELSIMQRLGDANPDKKEFQTQLSYAHKHLGSLLGVQKQLPAALEHYRAALAIDERQLSQDPGNVQARYNITFTYSDTGWIIGEQGDLDAALDYYDKALRIRAALRAADPNDARTGEGLSNTYFYVAWNFSRKGNFARALDSYSKSLALRQVLSQKDPANERLRFKIADCQEKMGKIYASMAEQAQRTSGEPLKLCRVAITWMQEALPSFQQREAQGKLLGEDVGVPETLTREISKCNRIIDRSPAQ